MNNNTIHTSDQVLAAALWHHFSLEPKVSISKDLMSAYFIFPKSGEVLDVQRRYLLDDINVLLRQYKHYEGKLDLKVATLLKPHRIVRP